MERDINNDIKINRFKLEEECEVQSSLYYFWAEKLAEVKAITDRTRSREKFIRAHMAKNIRENPPDNKKPTEAGVQELTEVSQEVIAATKAVNDASKIRYHLEAAVDSMNNRKRELDNLVELYVRGYYQTPSGRRPSTDDAQTAQRDRLNKKPEDNSKEEE